MCLPRLCQILACSRVIYEQILSFFTADKVILTEKKKSRNYDNTEEC